MEALSSTLGILDEIRRDSPDYEALFSEQDDKFLSEGMVPPLPQYADLPHRQPPVEYAEVIVVQNKTERRYVTQVSRLTEAVSTQVVEVLSQRWHDAEDPLRIALQTFLREKLTGRKKLATSNAPKELASRPIRRVSSAMARTAVEGAFV